MKLTIVKRIGKNLYPFTFEGSDLHEVLMESEKLSFGDVSKCGLCESDKLYLNAYTTKEDNFKYVKIVCWDCRGGIVISQKKSDPDIFYLRKRKDGSGILDWKEYEGDKQAKSPPPETGKKSEPTKPSADDEIFYTECKKLAEKDSDEYQKTLHAFEKGAYTTAKSIPVDKRKEFLEKFLPF